MYDVNTAMEKPGVPDDLVVDLAITEINQGVVKDFVENLTNWEDPSQKVLQIVGETNHEGLIYKSQDIYNIEEEEDKVVFASKSNLGKYKEKYGKLPEVGDTAKAMNNKKGYLKIKLD